MSLFVPFGDVLDRLIRDRKVTLKELADKTDISIPTISKIKNNQREPKWSQVYQISKAFGLSMADILMYADSLINSKNLFLKPIVTSVLNLRTLYVASNLRMVSIHLSFLDEVLIPDPTEVFEQDHTYTIIIEHGEVVFRDKPLSDNVLFLPKHTVKDEPILIKKGTQAIVNIHHDAFVDFNRLKANLVHKLVREG